MNTQTNTSISHPISPPNPAEVSALATMALKNTPEYVDHIKGVFGSCLEHLRSGADREAMMSLARGADDLHQFTLLIGLMVDASQGTLQGTARFRRELDRCVAEMQRALVANDLIAVSDQIDDVLLPLLQSWDVAADELAGDLAQA